ncbi:hypothetical protein ACYSNR_10535 [Enterococcus sp. LJL128]
MTMNEGQINRQLSQVSEDQEVNRKQRWQLEELEEDCQRLSSQHQEYLADVLQFNEEEEIRQYFSLEEDEVTAAHKKNFFELEEQKDALYKESKQLLVAEEELLQARKDQVFENTKEKEKVDGT